MTKEYMIISNKQCRISLILDEKNIDYYTDVTLELHFKSNKYVLLKDNVLYLKNIINSYVDNMDYYILDSRLNEERLGILLNEYYYNIYKNKTKECVIYDEKNNWIGEKYCCFMSLEYATWLYKYNNQIHLKVTPMFQYFDKKNNINEYLQFLNGYSEICNVIISLEELNKFFEILLELNTWI